MPARVSAIAVLLAASVWASTVSGPSAAAAGPGPTTTTSPAATTTTTTTVDPAVVGALVDGLNADLARLAAIGDYAPAQHILADSQAAAAAAGATQAQQVAARLAAVAAARARAAGTVNAEHAAQAALDRAKAGVTVSRRRLADLAVTLYVRPDYATESVADLAAGPGDRAVLTGLLLERVDAEIKAAHHRLIDDQAAVKSARAHVAEAGHAVEAAAATAARARAGQTHSAKAAAAVVAHAAAALAAVKLAAEGLGPLPSTPSRPGPGTAPTTTTTASGIEPRGATSRRPGGGLGPPILRPPLLTAAELAGWFASTGHQPGATVPITALAGYYIDDGRLEGVAGDVAFAQSVLETGDFSFPAGGKLVATDNNFAGIGACDSCAHGLSFPDARAGVQAQLQLLHSYASTQPVPTPLVGPVSVSGCCQTWMDLSGVWATNPSYGYGILDIYRQMLDWVLPQRAADAGLQPARSP